MPSEKRARQRAGRLARREAIARRQKRRRQVRSSFVVVLIAAVVIGSVYLITRHHTPKPTFPDTAEGRLEQVWVKHGCPQSSATRVNSLSFSSAPKLTISTTATYDATVKTDVGSFVMALDPKEAPAAVNSFVFLANKDFFNCVTFHRVVQGFVDQTGDPTGTGAGSPGYEFTDAGPPVATPQYPLGAVAMANSDSPSTTTPKTNGSQWFVVVGTAGEDLPPDYVEFGRVISGMKVVDDINRDGSASTAQKGTPKVVHRILTVKIKEVPS